MAGFLLLVGVAAASAHTITPAILATDLDDLGSVAIVAAASAPGERLVPLAAVTDERSQVVAEIAVAELPAAAERFRAIASQPDRGHSRPAEPYWLRLHLASEPTVYHCRWSPHRGMLEFVTRDPWPAGDGLAWGRHEVTFPKQLTAADNAWLLSLLPADQVAAVERLAAAADSSAEAAAQPPWLLLAVLVVGVVLALLPGRHAITGREVIEAGDEEGAVGR